MKQKMLFEDKVEFFHVESVIGSGYEVAVAKLALEDKIAYRAARKNMQIHSAIILKLNDECNKQIVIITKHWTNLKPEHLEYLNTINVCINTSVSALDKKSVLENALNQYNILKKYCKSVLRIVSCDFNLENETGKQLSDIQHSLFKNEDTLDTVLRVNKSNPLVKDGIIKIKQSLFLGKKTHISKFNKKTYFGKCSSCLEMCGLNINNDKYSYENKRKLIKEKTLFDLETIQQ